MVGRGVSGFQLPDPHGLPDLGAELQEPGFRQPFVIEICMASRLLALVVRIVQAIHIKGKPSSGRA